eukprot:GEMP01020400.1.p1 GENE.GEMP01020400.1~~GEMP01020400.1.p1  ORF type:complete len:313 (+),score=26.62 GEMP01020400.1:511-1449(+)
MLRYRIDSSGNSDSEEIEVPEARECYMSTIWTFMMILFPVFFVFGIVIFLLGVYMYHLLPGVTVHPVNGKCIELISFCAIFILDVYAYAMAAFTHPGVVPDTTEWEYGEEAASSMYSPKEMKRSGERRFCKWCDKYKPDRSHHCRVCKRCILKMDHHCPWLNTCIGFGNHKYFILTIFYSTVLSIFVSVSLFPTAVNSTKNDARFDEMLFYTSGETVVVFLSIVLVLFLGFHVWMFQNGLTTIEFCEKSLKRNFRSQYNHGFCTNMYNNLGPYALLWLSPCSLPSGDGCHFESSIEKVPIVPREWKRDRLSV